MKKKKGGGGGGMTSAYENIWHNINSVINGVSSEESVSVNIHRGEILIIEIKA